MKGKPIFSVLAFALGIFVQDAQAQQYYPHIPDAKEQSYAGVAELNRGQIEQAVRIWIEKANSGDAKANALLGDFYSEGKYVTPDYQRAISYLNVALAADNADAQFRMGWLFYNGLGVQQDVDKAFRFLQRASESGQIFAMEYLAKSYMGGQGTPVDLKQAVSVLFTIANPDWVKQSHPNSGIEDPVTHALSALSYLYTQQSDVLPRNLTVAYALALESEKIKPDPRTEQVLMSVKSLMTPQQEQNAIAVQAMLDQPNQFYKVVEAISVKTE